MNKLDKETKTLIYISLSITGILSFIVFTGSLCMITYGILLLLDIDISTAIIGIVIVLSSAISAVCSFLMNRTRYRLFKERSGFE